MVFWIACAALTAGVLLALMVPFARQRSPTNDSATADIAVYRDQLEEIERDTARGILSAEEAEASRIEISRRILARADPALSTSASAPLPAGRSGLLAVAVGVPVLALCLYLAVGSPGIPSYPAAQRSAQATAESPLPALISQVEARLRQHPEEGQGWDVIAPIYLRLDRYHEAW
jgi:cytochrome c-type biogenesis protein CcmH